jgi:hypothetical protein
MKNIAFSLGASVATEHNRKDITPAEWRAAMLLRLVTMHPSEFAAIETWDVMETEEGATQGDVDAATNTLPAFNPEGQSSQGTASNAWHVYQGRMTMRHRGNDSPEVAAMVIMGLLLHQYSKGNDPIQVLEMALSEFAERTMGHQVAAEKQKENDNGR